MKERVFLISFGLILGGIVFLIARPLLQKATTAIPEGASFTTVEEFHRVMLEDKPHGQESVELREIITPHPNIEIMYDLRPNLDVRFQGVPVQTNSCGMRQGPVTVPQTGTTFRVAFLGDSFTFGWGVKELEAFPQVVERILQSVAPQGTNVEVLNFGVPGYSTFQEVARFEEMGSDFHPDVVVVYFIENDFGLPFFISDLFHHNDLVQGTAFARKIWAARDDGPSDQERVIQRLLDPNAWLRRLAKLGREQGFHTFVAINPRPDWKKDRARLWILRKRVGPQLLRMRGEYLEAVERLAVAPEALSLQGDPHPSAMKHEILGEVLAAEIFPILVTERGIS